MKKKQLLTIAVAALAVITGTITVWVAAQQEDVTEPNAPIVAEDSGPQHEAGSTAQDYQAYSQFGLAYDAATDTLTYQGQTVRYFIDQYTVGEDSTAVVSGHFNVNGTIDLYAERDLTRTMQNADDSSDPSGTLLGVKAYSQEEFAARDLEALKNPVSQGAESGAPLSVEEKASLYAEYEAFGLVYNKETDRLTYEGKSVRYFLDVRSSNGKSIIGGGFEGSMTSMINDENGEIDLYTVRDFDQLNADVEGKLIEIEQYSQKEFDQRTADWNAEPYYEATGEVITSAAR